MQRSTVVWLVLVALLGALAGGVAIDDARAPVVAAFIAVVVGASARDAFVNVAVRAKRVAVADDAGVAVPAVVVGVVSSVLAFAVVVGANVADVTPETVPAWAATVAGGAIALGVARLWPLPTALGPVRSSTTLWLVGGAIVAAAFAAGLGAVVAVSRFGGLDMVTPGHLSRTLAATLLCDGLLGVGGFSRAATAMRAKRLVDGGPRIAAPAPLFVAMALAAVVVIVGPRAVPAVSVDVAIVVKVVVGAFVGGALHLCGGLRGLQVDALRAETSER